MKRREFIVGLGSAAAWPVLARAEQSKSIRRIGVLYGLAEDDPQWRAMRTAFVGEMRKLGWVEGNNLQIEYRTALGDPQRFRDYAAELVSLKPDLILGVSPLALAALAQQTRSIPIVFTVDLDPVREGHVASIAHPGGNITGFTDTAFEIGTKWPQLLKELVPNLRDVVLGYYPQPFGLDEVWMQFIKAGMSTVNASLSPTPIRDVPEISSVIGNLPVTDDNGFLLIPSAFTAVHRASIVEAVGQRGIPTVFPLKYYTVSGGLMSYSPDQVEEMSRAAGYVDRIFNGSNPGDLPVQEPTKFELVINLKTAKRMGITIPASLLARADEVIE
jgi:putative tryptophan/tyrosine transport system substrate-binding protein